MVDIKQKLDEAATLAGRKHAWLDMSSRDFWLAEAISVVLAVPTVDPAGEQALNDAADAIRQLLDPPNHQKQSRVDPGLTQEAMEESRKSWADAARAAGIKTDVSEH